MKTEPTAELDGRFSSEDAKATPWADVVTVLQESEVFWLSTVPADGRPHVTTLLAGWYRRQAPLRDERRRTEDAKPRRQSSLRAHHRARATSDRDSTSWSRAQRRE